MPVSRSGKLYFTEEQLKRAKAYSALEYAREKGYNLVRDGNTHYLREHDSMVFTADGRWFWNARGLKGRALEFIIQYEGCALPQAVLTLAGDTKIELPRRPTTEAGDLPDSGEKKLFKLPARAPQFRQLFAYLCTSRKLDFEIVQELVRSKRIYEGIRRYTDKTTGEERELHNAVFLGLDKGGVARSAFQRGLYTFGDKPFKREVASSEKERFAFCVPGRQGVTAVAVFEASIDAISHATLEKLDGGDHRRMDRIALGGVAAGPLLCYLADHPEVKEIHLCLDSDTAGTTATAALSTRLAQEGFTPERGYRVLAEAPPSGKDWNEHLVRRSEDAVFSGAGDGGDR